MLKEKLISGLKNVKSYLPSSKETLKKEQPELYDLLSKHNVC